MREVGSVERQKKTFNISQEEFIEGSWLKILKSYDKFEIVYKNNFLIIHTAKFKKSGREEK